MINLSQQINDILNRKLKVLYSYTIWIGVIDGVSDLKRDDYEKVTSKNGEVYYKKKKRNSVESSNKKFNNAQILNALSNGWDIKGKDGKLIHVPARPILDIAINQSKETLIPNFYKTCIDGVLNKGWNDDDILKQMHILGDRIASLAKNIIYENDGTLESNSPSTISQKGFNHPLFKTSQLAKSITYYVAEN